MNVYDMLTRLQAVADGFNDCELAEFVNYVRELQRNKDAIDIPYNNGKIVAYVQENGSEFPPEIYVYLKDKEDCDVQDICMVRAKGTGVECMVWADHNNDDYTHKFKIEEHVWED